CESAQKWREFAPHTTRRYDRSQDHDHARRRLIDVRLSGSCACGSRIGGGVGGRVPAGNDDAQLISGPHETARGEMTGAASISAKSPYNDIPPASRIVCPVMQSDAADAR